MTTDVAPLPTPARPARRGRVVAVSIATALMTAGGLTWWRPVHRAPPPNGPAADVVRFVAGDGFKSLPGPQKQAYVDRLEAMPVAERRTLAKDAGLTPEQGRAAYKNAYDQAVRARINKYFTLRTDAERIAYLDRLIDEFEREQAFTKPEGGTPGGRTSDPSRIKERLETVPAADRAKAASFLQAFVQRGVLRGLGLARPAGR